MDRKKNEETGFTNFACRFFPCHREADPEAFNCMFCYCPLYVLDDACGGNFTYTPQGVKDCSACLLPHSAGGCRFVLDRVGEVQKLMERLRGGIK